MQVTGGILQLALTGADEGKQVCRFLHLPGKHSTTRLRIQGTPPLHSWRTESGMEGKKDNSLTRGLLLYRGLGAPRPFAMGYQWVHQRPLQWPLTQLPWHLMTSSQPPTTTLEVLFLAESWLVLLLLVIPRKRRLQLRNYLHHIGLWTCLWGTFLVANWLGGTILDTKASWGKDGSRW